MKTPNKSLILVLLTFAMLWAPHALAEFTRAKCEGGTIRNDVIQVNRQWDEQTQYCYLTVHPRNSVGLKYRDYYFDNTGFFMVFNSYGPGEESKTAGSRSFFVLPKIEDYPDYSFEQNGDVVVKMVSGHLFRISGKDFSIISLSDASITEKPLSPNNQGGVEIKLTRGFWIDGGFKMGGTKMGNPNSKSKISSATSSQSCSMTNKSYLTYDEWGEFNLKYTGEKLTRFLKTQCPQLKL